MKRCSALWLFPKKKHSRGIVKNFFFVTFNVIIIYIYSRRLHLNSSGHPEDMKTLFLKFNKFSQLFGRTDILFVKNKKTPKKHIHKKKLMKKACNGYC